MRALPTSAIDAIQWWVILATAAAVPLVYSRWTFDVFNIAEATTLRVGVVVALGLQLAKRELGVRRDPVLWSVIAVYVVVVGAATLGSRAPWVSLFGLYGRLGGLTTLVPAVLLGWLLSDHLARRTDRRHQLVVAVAVSSCAGAAYLIGQQLDIETIAWLESPGRRPSHPPGLLGNSNFSGAHVAIGLPALAWCAGRARGHARAAWVIATAIALVGVAVSQSRGAMVAAAIGLGVLATLLPERPRWTPVAALTAVVFLGGAALVTGNGFGELTDPTTSGERVDLWQVALEGSTDHLVLGGGPDLYLLTFDEHAGPELAGVSADEPHNVVLDHLDGSGVVGALAWLAVVAAVVHTARPIARRTPMALWLATGSAYLAQAMVSIDVVPLVAWAWVVVGAVAGVAASPSQVTPVHAPPRRSDVIAVGAGVAVAVVGSVLVVQPFLADMSYRRGVEAANAGATASATYQFTQATERNPWEPRYHRRLGVQLRSDALAGDADAAVAARAAFDDALRLFPQDPDARAELESLGSPQLGQ